MQYDVNAKILKAENFGVPQARRRAFFLAKKYHLDFDLPEDNGIRVTVMQAIDDLPALKSGEGKEVQAYTKQARTHYQKAMRKKSKFVRNHVSTNHSRIA